MSFVHLHVHSEYSLLDGFSNVKKLIQRVQEMGMPAIALTDHGTMFGTIEFYNTATAAGVKPIIGLETYLAARRMEDRDPKLDKQSYHLLLLAENATGYRNLLKLASTAQMRGFYYFPRVDKELIAAHSEGLIATTGCMAAEIPRTILREGPDAARKKLDWYYDVFGPDRFFIELQQHEIKELPTLNKALLSLGSRYQARYVATNDVHYINPADARLQDIMLAIQTGSLLADDNRFRMTDESYYLRSPQEMSALFSEVPEALSNTLLIAERCNVDLKPKGYHLPNFEVPEGFTPQSYLRQLCEDGLQQRYGVQANDPTVRQRLEYELQVIHEMGFDAYFLIVWDLCRYARQEGVWYNARGSAAGSMVAYTLDITLVEPIDHGLIFERFLNPGRISMPDIDLDFQDDKRAKIMEYCASKYGDDKVAQIITFGTLGARAAIRDVGRVMDIPISEVDRVAKLIPNIPGKPLSISEALQEVPELKAIYDETDYFRSLIDTASQMEGVVRNAGTHAAGVVIADRPVIDYVPLHRPTSGAEDSPIKTVTQFEMSILDSLGLLKVDFLGLATLTIMARACELVNRRHGVNLDLHNIPTDDPQTYEFIGQGHTAGVFQLEGTGMTRYITQMKPQSLANVIAMVALYRPGPMEFIPQYIRRMHGEEKVTYRHPAMEPIFKETYGIPIYQEQIMFAAMELAGYTASQADELRKAISKKKADAIAQHRKRFVEGATGRGIPQETASQIFEDWENFARYGFNKCLTGDTEVVDATTGRVVSIEDLFYRRASLESTLSCDLDRLRLQPGRIAAVHANGIKPVFRLKTASGRSIEATGNHPFYTFGGWRNLEALKVGDWLAVPRRIPVEGQMPLPDHEVILLGHLLAEGILCHPHSVYFYSQDPAQRDGFIRAAEQFENVQCTISLHKGTYTVYAGRKDRRRPPGIVPWAQALGLWGKNAIQKAIPGRAFELPNHQVGLLIAHMWEGDGHINTTDASLYYATSSRRLAFQVQHLLLRLGITSRVREVRFPYKEGRIGYQVFVTSRENFALFASQIGQHFISPDNRRRLEVLLSGASAHAGVKDVVPVEVKALVRSAKAQRSLTWTQLREATGVAPREFYPVKSAGKQGFPRQTLARLAAYFADADLQRYADNDIYWDRVAAIECVGEKPTYDLEIESTHNFIANDILVHNSHAADYGVIAVKTAYLKAHYTIEYMTAVLSASKNDTEKVAFYVADARSMGISVLPPDINASDWDFTIEDRPGEPQAIRFGLGAVKNVGQGAVELILKARQEGPFRHLTDFARRVDLRQVGKRPLECLVRVGALDAFGPRPVLLEALDRIASASASHFRAVESRQMSFFDTVGGTVDEITLPLAASQAVDRRELLNWERDLIGLYVSEHPLTPYLPTLKSRITHLSGQLGEANKREKVSVAGMVTRFRTHHTKDGKLMGFVSLEDVQGSIELVVFPRAWDQYAHLVAIDKVLLVEGKVDAQSGDPKLLVDRITPVGNPPEPVAVYDTQPQPPAERSLELEPAGAAAAGGTPVTAGPAVDDSPFSNMPPPPPTPDDWDLLPPPDFPESDEWPPGTDAPSLPAAPRLPAGAAASRTNRGSARTANRSGEAARTETTAAANQAGLDSSPAGTGTPSHEPRLAPYADEQTAEGFAFSSPDPSVVLPPFIVSPTTVQTQAQAGDEPRMVTITLRSTGDRERDVRRLRCIHGALLSCPGRDRFAFLVFETGKRYLLEFPNETTGVGSELIGKLIKFAGEENIRIDPLKIQ